MTQMYVPQPLFDNDQAAARLKKAEAAYLEQRQALEKEHGELEEMKATLADHRNQAEAANRQAEAAIRAAKGKETEESISLQEMAIRKERQIRVVESMVAAQEPVVELLRIDTYGARITYTSALSDARLAANHEAVHQAAQALADGEAGRALANALPLLTRQAEDQLYGSPMYMATYGISTNSLSPEEGRATTPWMNNGDISRLKDDLRLQRMAAIGELLSMYLPQADDAASEAGIKSIERLACELSPDEAPKGIELAQRRAELTAAVKELAA